MGDAFRHITSRMTTRSTTRIPPHREAPTYLDLTPGPLGRGQLATLGLTSTFGATAVNELRLGYMRTANNVGQPVGGVGPSLASQGFVDPAGKAGIVALAPKIEGIENVAFNDFTIGVDTTGAAQANNTFQWSDNFSKVAGKHTLKVGASLHLDQVNIHPDAIYNGSFMFQGTETGSDFADFLLGIASSYTQGDSKAFYLRNRYAGLYGQDSWQIRPNLTFNFGLRWDLLPPWREKYNQLQTLVPGQQSVVYPGAPAGPGLSRRSRSSRHAGAGQPYQLRSSTGSRLFTRREDQYPSGLRPLLHRLRRIVCRYHERQSAVRLRLRQLRAAAIRHSLHYSGKRPGHWAAVPGADSGERRLRQKSQYVGGLVPISADYGSAIVLSPQCDAL